MPTIWREAGYRFFFYSNEGEEPPHVHVSRGGGYAKIWLTPVQLALHRGLTFQEVRTAVTLAERRQIAFLEAWNDHHYRP